LKKIEKSMTGALLALVLLASMTLLITTVSAQNQAVVVIPSSAGGTTSPGPGTYTYNEGETITLTATPDEGFEFAYWVASGSYTPGHEDGVLNEVLIGEETGDPEVTFPRFPAPTGLDALVFTINPLNILCGYGYTYKYQAVFTPVTFTVTPPTPLSPDELSYTPGVPAITYDTIVELVSSTGGTTNPSPGKYAFVDLQQITMTAVPNQNFEFQYWVVKGDYLPGHDGGAELDSLTFTDNPLTITCGDGYLYSYQPVFTPVSSPPPTSEPPTTPPPSEEGLIHPPFGLSAEAIIALIAILAIVVVIAILFGVYMWRRGKSGQ
jgi:hypothetical protein